MGLVASDRSTVLDRPLLARSEMLLPATTFQSCAHKLKQFLAHHN